MEKRGLTLEAGLVVAIVIVLLVLVTFIGYGVVQDTSSEDEGIDGDNETDGGSGSSTSAVDCNDGIDNDGDGYVDLADYGCSSSTDDSEINDGNTECSDGIDNDGDGFLDHEDGQCDSQTDDSENGGTGDDNESGGDSDSFSVTIVSPADDSVLGIDIGIFLNFTISNTSETLDSCWYNLDGGSNVSVGGCVVGENSAAFDASDGNHTIKVYANTSDDEEVDSHFFIVNVGAPKITLGDPLDNTYSNSVGTDFHYVPLDSDLASCQLWGDFTGTFGLNQTDTAPLNNQDNLFSLSLTEGQHIWNIYCNDTAGNGVSTSNRTLFMDFTDPDLLLIEPSNNAYVDGDLEVVFNVSDASPINCDVSYTGPLNENPPPVIVSAACGGTESVNISLVEDGDYLIEVDVLDSAGNTNSTSKTISLNLPCQFSNAGWSVAEAVDDENVELILNGSNCDVGEAVNVSIYEVNLAGDDTFIEQIDGMTFNNDAVVIPWVVPNSGGNQTEYYYNATLSGDLSVMIQSDLLLVNGVDLSPFDGFDKEADKAGFIAMIVITVLVVLIIITIFYIQRSRKNLKNE